jgi:neurofilament light polypeptide
VGPRLAQRLIQEGYVYVQNLRTVDVEALCQLPGVGEKTAERILEAAEIMLEEAEKAVLGDSAEEAREEAAASEEGGWEEEGGEEEGGEEEGGEEEGGEEEEGGDSVTDQDPELIEDTSVDGEEEPAAEEEEKERA